MNGIVLLLIAVVLFVGAYILYGGWLAKKWGIDDGNVAPSIRLRDDVDYCPTDKKVVFGHQFSSIAGAGPITGPIQAIIFGWLPVYLWIVLGSIFIGGVHDWGSLFASMRHDGKSIGEVIRANVGETAKKLFNIFSWLALVLVVAAFTDICAGTFAYDPAAQNLTGARAGTASILFIALAIAFGYFVYRRKANLALSTVIGVAVLFACILIGYLFPVVRLPKLAWSIILLAYITAASVMPVWILLQPRDYLCSFLLYATLIGAFLGIVIVRPSISVPMFTSFRVGEGASASYLFPILFITVACGAISGFHSLVSSGTSSKQVSKESDSKLIGYGAMLVEGVIAVIAVIAVGFAPDTKGTPAQIFAGSVARFMNSFGIPVEVGEVFVTLAFSAFALTSLDTATRIARYQFQELLTDPEKKNAPAVAGPIPATLITVGCALLLLLYGYQNIWPIFGASNQLLGAMSLLGLTVWFYKTNRPILVTVVPMGFMFIVTLSALALLIRNFFLASNYVLGIIAVVLAVLAVVLLITALRSLAQGRAAAAKK